MNFYSPSKNKIVTDTELRMMGLNINLDILKTAGWYPVFHEQVDYDPLFQTIILTSTEKQDSESGEYYLQHFQVIPLTDDQLTSVMNNLVENRIKELNSSVANQTESYLSKYSELEIQSFEQQRSEIQAYLKNSKSKTPLLKQLSENRGIPLSELIDKAKEKVAEYQNWSAGLIGKCQQIRDSIYSIRDSDLSLREKISQIRDLKISFM